MADTPNPNRARDHLANERTFLAWVRTGAAIVVFGFAIGRFSVAMRQLTSVLLVVAGLVRYRKTRTQVDSDTFEPAGFVVDLVTILTVVFGLVLAGYLIYTEKSLG